MTIDTAALDEAVRRFPIVLRAMISHPEWLFIPNSSWIRLIRAEYARIVAKEVAPHTGE